MTRPRLSVLDLAPIAAGSSSREALRHSVELAQFAERLGYVRQWFAEHHGMPSIASSAPELLIAHVATQTEHIRLGSGGIMLPNHAPLRIAEAFLTLEALHPDRIDLGIGRAPGADRKAMAAMRPFEAEYFPTQLNELMWVARGEFPEGHPFEGLRAVPNDVQLPPMWLLGSSGASARLAGSLGLGYSFARHFSPAPPAPAMLAYRESFQPSEQFPEPHSIIAVSVVCADTEEEADYLAGALDLMWVRFQRNEFGPVPTPEMAAAYEYSPAEQAIVRENRGKHFIGTPRTVVPMLEAIVEETQADEVMVTNMVPLHDKRLHTYELLARAWYGEGSSGGAAG